MSLFTFLIFLNLVLPNLITGSDSRSGGRRPFGSGFRRDYDDRRDEGRSSGERSGDRYGDREERYERRDEKQEDKGRTVHLIYLGRSGNQT